MRDAFVWISLVVLVGWSTVAHSQEAGSPDTAAAPEAPRSGDANGQPAAPGGSVSPSEEPVATSDATSPATPVATESGNEAPAATSADPSLLDKLQKLEQRLVTLEAEREALEQKVNEGQGTLGHIELPHLTVPDGVRLRFTGYADLGLFGTLGDGVAYVRAPGKTAVKDMGSFPWLIPYPARGAPDVSKVPWVFFGDPWANSVNSLGESADLGLDRTNIERFDPIDSNGHPTFLVNVLNVGMLATVGRELLFEVSANLMPRTGTLGSAGDYFDVDLAYVEWVPFESVDLSLFAGKFEPVFGREYRDRKSPTRFGVTPSIMSRYTVGTPIGLKVRGSFFDRLLTYNFAVTNGASSTELFAHFYNEVDQNYMKTLSGRLSSEYAFTLLLPVFFELGVSGLVGPQDGQPSDTTLHWQVGADAKLVVDRFALVAEYIRLGAPGGGPTAAPSIEAEGAYLEATLQILPWLGVLARGDIRRALLLAHPNLYISDVARATLGARFDITWNVIAKLEYVRLQELTGPEINDDVFTSSLVLRF